MAEAPELGADIRVDGSTVRCGGAWTVYGLARVERLLPRLPWPTATEVVIDGSEVRALDLAGAWVLRGAIHALEGGGRTVELRLRPEHAALLRMVTAPELSAAASGAGAAPGAPARLGAWALAVVGESAGVLTFLGESARVAARGLARPARIRWRAVFHNVQAAGFDALPIVGMLSFLMGIVIAYQGASQLRRYGANIFVADLVGFAMLRELSPLLTAIIVAGRSGSAFAAQIGTMKVTEEIDALRTVGISPT
jgi:phospholipid/cholesterol/gamma-HCH transport system permease protein